MKKFIVPEQKINRVVTWKQVCPNCTSIEELSETTEYDIAVSNRGYENETIYGIDYSNPRPLLEETKRICTNCGYVFETGE